MDILKQYVSRFLRRAADYLHDSYYISLDMIGSITASKSGSFVTPATSLRYSAVYACVRILSETMASLPLITYERLEEGKRRATEHPLYDLLHSQANPLLTSFQFRELMQSHILLWGDCYAEIEWDRVKGVAKALWPLDPSKTKRITKDGKSTYETVLPDGKIVTLDNGRVFHVAGFGTGYSGYSMISLHREAIGLGMATEEFGSRFFSNGARPSGVLEASAPLSDAARKNLKESWSEANGGLEKQQRMAILEAGVTYKQIGVPPEDAQFLATRKFQVEEIARIFRVPPHLLQNLDRATNNNIEHQSLEFIIHTMRPWLVRWEQEFSARLFTNPYYAEFLVDGLLRGDIQSRYAAYAVGRNWGWLSADDIRGLENMNPLPDGKGKVYLQPLNMIEAGTDLTPKEESSLRLIADLKSRSSDAVFTEEQKRAGGETDKNYAILRHRTANSLIPVYKAAYAKIVARDVSNVLRSAKKYLQERSEGDFILWLDEHYRDFPEYIRKELRAVVDAMVAGIAPIASEQVGIEIPELQNMIDDHLYHLSNGYARSSKNQLLSIIRDNQASLEPEDPYMLIEQRVSEWEEKRPGKESMDGVVNTSNLVAKTIFFVAGKKLIWEAIGSETCPYCQEMDGKIVGRDQPFLGNDEILDSEDGQMTINKPAMQPPLHRGCVCQVNPY